NEFRVDEAKLFVEAPLGHEIYFFTEVNLITRESYDDNIKLGELYVEFEDLLRFWNHPDRLNVRAGRMDIPFGEEYLTRDAIDNPLILHSITDFWGVDEGVEVYGRWNHLHYVLAVQNGGHPILRDFNSDKSVTARATYDAPAGLHFALS